MLLKTAEMCQWPRLPSDLWNLNHREYSHSQRLDFDFAVHDYWKWHSNQREVQKQVKTTAKDKLKDGYHYVPRYTDQDILDMYYAQGRGVLLDPLVATTTDAELLEFFDDDEETISEGTETPWS